MVYHSKNISVFRKPAFLGISIFGSILFFILQIGYWQNLYASKPVICQIEDTSLNWSYTSNNKIQPRNYEIYPNVALKILKAIHHYPKISSLTALEKLTQLDSAVILNTLQMALEKKSLKKYVIELNSVDSAILESLPKIGAKTASRIIKYRNRLGGFISKYQLWELKFIDSSIVNNENIEFKINLDLIQKIDINLCSIIDLYKHPYLGKPFAKLVWAYKIAHYPLTAQKFSEMKGIPQELIIRMTPYLKFSE